MISKIVDAIDEGLIEFEEDEDDSEEDEEVEEVDEEEVTEEVDEEEEENMTEVRRSSIVELENSIREMYKNEEITDKDMKEFLESYHEHLEGECSDCNCPNEDRLDCYIKIQTNLIDDEGTQHDFSCLM